MWPFIIASAVGSVIKRDAENKQNADYNEWAYNQKKAAAKTLRIKGGSARQGLADIDRMSGRDADITADQQISNKLESMRRVSAIKSVGGPVGQSTDAYTDRSIGEVLQQENAFLKDMEVKQEQYAMQEREIKYGMDMAFLDAQASIDSYRYRRGDGGRGLMMDFANIGAKAYGMS